MAADVESTLFHYGQMTRKLAALIDVDFPAGELPTLRGHVLTGDDRRRRAIIESLMTSFHAALAPDEIDAARAALAPLEADGLIDVDSSVVRVRPGGRPFLRNIAAAFDAHLRAAPPATPTFSRAL